MGYISVCDFLFYDPFTVVSCCSWVSSLKVSVWSA